MSDLQDVIASSSIKAFNNGVYYERERIVAMLRELRKQAKKSKISGNANINAIIGLIKGESVE
jgi:chorismate mutase